MTYLDEMLKKMQQTTPVANTPDIQPDLPKPNPAFSPLRNLEAAGGALLTKTVAGLSTPGQFVLGMFNQLEQDLSIYDELYGKKEDGTYDNRAGKFHWDKLDDVGKRVLSAGWDQAQRTFNSDNLTDLGSNVISGAQILKQLPGSLGEDFRDQKQGSKIATAILGFGLEMVTDPAGVLGKGAKVVGKGVTTAAGLSDNVASITGRLAGNLASGNIVAGPIAMGLRETSLKVRSVAQRMADDTNNPQMAARASNFLEWAYGPMSLATKAMRPVLNQYAALKEELPKQMLKASSMAATITGGIPARFRKEAQDQFSVLASNLVDSPEAIAAREKLLRLGVKNDQIDAVSRTFFDGNKQIIGLLDEGKDLIPDLDVKLRPEHLRQTYRMFMNPSVLHSHLDALIAANTPASFQVAQGHLRNRLDEAFGLTQGQQLQNAVGDTSFRSGLNKTDAVVDALPEKVRYRPGTVNRNDTARVVKPEYGVGPEELAGKSTMAPAKLKQYENLTGAIDVLDKRIETTTGAQLDKLVSRRNALLAKLDTLTAPPANRTGLNQNAVDDLESRLGKGRTDAVDARLADDQAAATVQGRTNAELNPQFPLKVDNTANTLGQSRVNAATSTGTYADKAIASATNNQAYLNKTSQWIDELLPAEKKYVAHTPAISTELRSKFLDDLSTHLGDSSFSQNRVAGFKFNEQGVPVPSFQDDVAKAKQSSFGEISRFAADWADTHGVTGKAKSDLIQNTIQSMVYVPGSKEFARGVRNVGSSLKELGEMRKYVAAELGMEGADTGVIAAQKMDPVFDELMGKITEFTPRAADQGVEVGNLAAQVKLRTEMRKRGLVLNAQDINDLPEAQRAGWTEVPEGIFGEKGMYAHQTNIRAIQAIDRSLGDLGKGPVAHALQTASNLFRRAALITDPSAHATQYLGNLAMLKMMGYNEMFSNTPRFAKDIHSSAHSIMMADSVYSDAIDAGVSISQTVLGEAEKARLVNAMLNTPAQTNAEGAVKYAFNLMQIPGQVAKGAAAVGNSVERTVTRAVQLTGKNYDEASALSRQVVSPAQQFQMADQLTRMYAYKVTLRQKSEELVRANPWLRPYMSKETGIVDWDSLSKFNEKQGAAGKAGLSNPDEIQLLQEAYKSHREEAAQIANDVALNYQDVPLAVTYASKTGVVPFIKFQYKAMGRIMEWFDEKPWVFSPFYQAQRNANTAFSDDPNDWDASVRALPSTVRQGLVVPTGNKSTQGMPEFLDLTRWVPFGMFAQAAGGGQGEFDTGRPSSIVSTPILDLWSAMATDEGRQDGQSKYAFMASKLAENFAPSGWGAGGRRIDGLARAIEQTAFYVDGEGNVVPREKTGVQQAITAYNALPEKVGAAIGRAAGDPGSPQGTPNVNELNRTRTTPEAASGRFFVPGYAFASDQAMTTNETFNKIEMQINELKKNINATGNKDSLSAEDQAALTRWQQMIGQLELYRERQVNRLHVGE